MEYDRIKIGQIGLNFGKIHHVDHLMHFDDVELYICDIDNEKLNEVKTEYNIESSKCFTDYQQLLDKVRPHAIILSMPQYTIEGGNNEIYFKICENILSRKINLMVEKPLAVTVEKANELAKLAVEAGVVTMVNVNRTFAPLLNHCLNKVREHGNIISTVCEYYKNEKNFPGHVSMRCDQIHAIDMLRYINKYRTITDFNSNISFGENEKSPVAFQASMKFENGALGLYSGNIRSGARRELYQINGYNICCYLETCAKSSKSDMRAKIYRDNNIYEPEVLYDSDISGSPSRTVNRGFVNADRTFIECIKKNKQPRCNFADNAIDVELCNKILNKR
jgi:predicted dehydrogenase